MANTLIYANYPKTVHIRGGSEYETLCGWVDTANSFTDSVEKPLGEVRYTNKLPTCPGCIASAYEVFANITKEELSKCKPRKPQRGR